MIAHELAHTLQQGDSETLDAGAENSALEHEADTSAVGATLHAAGLPGGAIAPPSRTGLRLQRCETEREKEIKRLGGVQYAFIEQKRKEEEERQRKEAEAEAKKKGLPPPPAPKVEVGEVINKEVAQHSFGGKNTDAWTKLPKADQDAWKARAATAWSTVVASVKGTALEKQAKGTTFKFDPETALDKGWYAWQNEHTLTVGMSWVKFAEMDPKNVWENLAHEMGGHFEYGTTYGSEIMQAAMAKMPKAEREKWTKIPAARQKFFETYEYPGNRSTLPCGSAGMRFRSAKPRARPAAFIPTPISTSV